MIDLHCHVLPGIDDGPSSWEESVALVRACGAGGVAQIAATPHVSAQYPNDSRVIGGLVEQLNERLAAAGVDVEVLPGAEVAITQLDELAAGELERLVLGGGSGGWLLLESPFTPAINVVVPVCERLLERGFSLLLAHPERCPGFHRRPELLRALTDRGVITSVTAGALSGQFGREVERFALWMAAEGLLDTVASDAHDLHRRPPGLLAPLERAGLAAHVEQLTRSVPAALLAGEEPQRPGVLRAEAKPGVRRRWGLRRDRPEAR
ncbi:MAG: tyrosine-protein phosphatase [Solirubrobacteraceae bacterium]